MEEIVYLNGSLLPRSQARVSVYDYGFLYGYALFETMRAYRGKIFLLERHLERLMKSAGIISISSGLAEIDLPRACKDTLIANNLENARLRLTVSRGEIDSFPGYRVDIMPTVLITARKYVPLPEQTYSSGYRALISSYRRYSLSLLSRIKSANYLLNVMAKMEAEAAGLDEALLLDERGFIAEGSISNIFFVTEQSLVTPSLDSGILPGITRGVVMEIARSLGVGVIEREVKPEELERFSEAFLTNSVMAIMPLVEVRDNTGRSLTIGSGRPGKLTRRLMAAYSSMVEKETNLLPE